MDRAGRIPEEEWQRFLGMPPVLLLCSLQLLGPVLLWVLEMTKAGPAFLQLLHSSRTCSPPRSGAGIPALSLLGRPHQPGGSQGGLGAVPEVSQCYPEVPQSIPRRWVLPFPL